MSRDGEAPHPRILLEKVPDHLVGPLAALAGYSERIEPDGKMHGSDWDILVTFSPGVREPGPYHVLSIGAQRAHGKLSQDPPELISLTRTESTYARSTWVSDDLSPALRSLAQRSIADLATPGTKSRHTWRGTVEMSPNAIGHALTLKELRHRVQPLVQLGDEGFIHAFMARSYGSEHRASLLWALPKETEQIPAWLQAFIEHLRMFEPDRFPEPSTWRTSPRWSTRDLHNATQALREIREQRVAAIAKFDAEEAFAEQALRQEQDRAASMEQQLLTADGDELVLAVARCLRDLGFEVAEMDDHHDERTGAKLEDLRVTDSSSPKWIALVEVKGYTKGAKATDIAQITGRPALAYFKETGTEPDQLWHIVNAFRNNDPDRREQPLSSADVDLQSLTDASGSLIDTRELFLAQKAAHTDAQRREVRESLRVAIGRWKFADGQS